MRYRLKRLKIRPNPATTYTEALAQLDLLRSRSEPSPLNPVCETILLTHGEATDRVIVLLHGYTNCPQQFRLLGQQFFERGYNVLIPRLPRHGLADRMNKDLAALSAEEIVALGSAAVDIAVGLGRHVTITGISTGGVLAAWLAYQRTDIKSIGLIAPVLGLSAVPPMLTGIATRFLLASPNQYMWWGDPEEIDQGALHAYPRFSTKALGQILRISAGVRRASRRGLPHCESIVVVDNDNDTGVSQPIIKKTIATWQRRGAADLRTYTFGREHQLDHDLIDPDHPQQNVALVYPKLLSLII